MHSLFFIALLAWAQVGAMTLADVETEALANNPEIRGLQQQVRVAESRSVQRLPWTILNSAIARGAHPCCNPGT